MNTEYTEYENKMKKTIEVLQNQLATIRAGRANVAVLDQIRVEYYGTPTPIQQIASVATPDPRTLVIQPWDMSSLKAIEKAIMTSELGINPINDGKVIRLGFQQLTEERRKELIKQVHKCAEDHKVMVRNIRRDLMDKLKDMKKNSDITEDDQKDGEKQLQTTTDKFCKEIEDLTSKKEKEIMEI